MTEYANDHLNIFMQEKYHSKVVNSKDHFSSIKLTRRSLLRSRRMNELMVQLLKEKRQKILLAQDTIEKIQKNMNVMGPLCKLWESLEIANKELDSSVSINHLIKFVTQSIILVGPTNIALSYHRRLSALGDVMKSTIQVKSM